MDSADSQSTLAKLEPMFYAKALQALRQIYSVRSLPHPSTAWTTQQSLRCVDLTTSVGAT